LNEDPLYRCIKKMECSAQGMMFDIPQPGSEAYRALAIDTQEVWKLGALIEYLIWFRDKAAASANRVFMENRSDLKTPPA
jgi:hypothetical protein